MTLEDEKGEPIMMKNIKHNAAQVAAPSNLSSPGCDRFLRVSRRRKQAPRGRWNISLRPSVFGNTNDGVNENEGKCGGKTAGGVYRSVRAKGML